MTARIPLLHGKWTLRLAAGASVGLTWALWCSAATAAPQPCSRVTNAEHRAAITLAEAWWTGHWQRTGQRWITAYTLKPEPPAPLGIGSFAKATALGVAATRAGPIAGLAAVTAVTCTTYEMGPDQAYIVHFSGRALSFNENATGWSRPLRAGLLQALELRPAPPADTVGFTVRPLAGARTALPPDATLTLPAAATLPAALVRRR